MRVFIKIRISWVEKFISNKIYLQYFPSLFTKKKCHFLKSKSNPIAYKEDILFHDVVYVTNLLWLSKKKVHRYKTNVYGVVLFHDSYFQETLTEKKKWK